MKNVYFFLPESETLPMPRDIESFWDWQCSTHGVSSLWGRYHWVLQTYLNLIAAGLPVKLVGKFPENGIVFAHRDDLNSNHKPDKNLFIVCMLVDRDAPHPHANIHILHNPIAQIRFDSTTHYIPPWPQIGLRKRLVNRGQTFKRVGFFGSLDNMAERDDLDYLRNFLDAHDLELVIPPPEKWNDFSEIDLIYGVRNYGVKDPALHKPALKLINAWMAEIPAIFGYESAYRAEGSPGVNYLEATSRKKFEQAIYSLKNDATLRSAIVNAGAVSAKNFSIDKIQARWISLLEKEIIPAFVAWRSSDALRLRHRVAGKLKANILKRFIILDAPKIHFLDRYPQIRALLD